MTSPSNDGLVRGMAAKSKVSPRIQRLAKDFSTIKGEYQLTTPKLKQWLTEFEAVPVDQRVMCASELLALALRFEKEGGPPAIYGAAQLYYCAATLIGEAAKAAGWGTKKK